MGKSKKETYNSVFSREDAIYILKCIANETLHSPELRDYGNGKAEYWVVVNLHTHVLCHGDLDVVKVFGAKAQRFIDAAYETKGKVVLDQYERAGLVLEEFLDNGER